MESSHGNVKILESNSTSGLTVKSWMVRGSALWFCCCTFWFPPGGQNMNIRVNGESNMACKCVSLVTSWWSGAGNDVILWPWRYNKSLSGHLLMCYFSDLWMKSWFHFLINSWLEVDIFCRWTCESYLTGFFWIAEALLISLCVMLATGLQLSFVMGPKVVASWHRKLLWEKNWQMVQIKGRVPGDEIICHSQGEQGTVSQEEG